MISRLLSIATLFSFSCITASLPAGHGDYGVGSPNRGCGCATQRSPSQTYNSSVFNQKYPTQQYQPLCTDGTCRQSPNTGRYLAPATPYHAPGSPYSDSRPSAPVSPYYQGSSPPPTSNFLPGRSFSPLQPAQRQLPPSGGEFSVRPQANVVIPQGMEGIAELPVSEQRIALQQRTCPVTKQPLGSMGRPIRVTVGSRSIYVCCQGCVSSLQKSPNNYLASSVKAEGYFTLQ